MLPNAEAPVAATSLPITYVRYVATAAAASIVPAGARITAAATAERSCIFAGVGCALKELYA